MFGPDSIFFHGIIRKYVIYFGSLFSDIWIQRDSSTKQILQTLRVPINYGPKEKFLARAEGNPDLDRPIAIQLPRMSFEISSLMYDSQRKLIPGMQNKVPGTDITYSNPIPYNIGFRLEIMTKSAEDATRIVEQILPVFNPTLTASLKLLDEVDERLEVPIILNDVSSTDTYEGNFETRRAMIWTLDFTMRAWFFGPVNLDGNNIIKYTTINLGTTGVSVGLQDANSTNVEKTVIDVYPGLTSSNTPVNWSGSKDAPNHPTDYVDPYTVEPDDNYGFIIDFSGED